MSVDVNCLASLLTEALAEIDELARRITELEKKISNIHESSLSYTPDNSRIPVNMKRSIPLSSLNSELSEDRSNIDTIIDRAVDSILKMGRRLDYINNK